MSSLPTTKYLTVLESVDEVLRCENLLHSNDENSPLVWHIYPNVGYLINPEINLNLQFKVKRIKKDGTKEAVKDSDVVCLANYPLMTMFRTAEVEFRQVNIVPANTLLPYTATLRVLNEFDRDGRDSILAPSLFRLHVPYKHNDIGPANGSLLQGVRADPYVFRHDPILDDNVVDLYGPLMLDIFRTSQPFPDDVDIRITLHRSPAAFVFNAKLDGDTAGYEITIVGADLCFTRIRTAENVYDRVGATIEYPFTVFETRHFIVTDKSMTLSQEIFNGTMPKRMICSFINQAAFVGKYSENPYYFGDNLLASLYFRKNQITSLPPDMFKTKLLTTVTKASAAIPEIKDSTGTVIKEAQPALPAKTDYSLTGTSRLYIESMKVLNDKSLNNVNIGITKEDFESGMFFMCTDFRAERKPPPGKTYVPGSAVVRMEATFHRELTKPILLLCILEYQRVLHLSRSGDVIVT